MQKRLFASLLSVLGLGLALPAWSADAQLEINLPTVQGSRVKRPYVAVWLEKAGSRQFAGNIALWYDTARPVGAKWLPDLRSWWRAIGSQSSLPIDGVSGATRPAGQHTINLGNAAAMKKLPAGDYEVVVEVSREHGGYDLVRVPLQWPPRAPQTTEAKGAEELGLVRLTAKP